MDGADGRLASPASAEYFAHNGCAPLGNGGGEFFGQIKIASDAFVVGTTEAEHGLGVRQVDDVVESPVLERIVGAVVIKIDGQRLQLRECLREVGGILDPLAFLLAVFSSGTLSVWKHACDSAG